MDVAFEFSGERYMVEAKHRYRSTTLAIRSAIGQVLDYNLYPGSSRREYWLILVNKKPHDEDFQWLEEMRDRFSETEFPVYLCWEDDGGFDGEGIPLFS